MVSKVKGSLENNWKQISTIMNPDPSATGFLNTNTGALSLPSWQTPDSLNVIPFPGRLQYRGGSSLYAAGFFPFTAGNDGVWAFFDKNGNKHFACWVDGTLFDYASGSALVIDSNSYTAGSRIGHQDVNGVLYWSVGQPNPTIMRFWDPVAGTHGVVTGANPIPATSMLFLYAGSLVACAPTTSGTYQPSVFTWSNVNDPTTWVPANAQQVGGLDGGVLLYGQPMGVSNTGVPPARAMLIGKSTRNLYLYSGALGSLTEAVVSCPVGMLSGDSAAYIPAPTGYGYVAFLGSDFQFYWTNGVQSEVISSDILPSLFNTIQNSLTLNPKQRFYGSYNQQYQYYMCDMGNSNQFIFRWQTKAWAALQGWPSGPAMSSTDSTGFPTVFVLAVTPRSPNPTVDLVSLGAPDTNDYFPPGNVPSIYYKTPYLHGGAPELLKNYGWVSIFVLNRNTVYKVNAIGLPRSDNTSLTSQILTFTAPNTASSSTSGIWDVSKWDVAFWASGNAQLTSGIAPLHGKLACPVATSRFGRSGLTEPMKSGAVQFTIAYSSGSVDFDLVGCQTRFVPAVAGFRGVGNAKYSTDNGISLAGPDPFTSKSP